MVVVAGKVNRWGLPTIAANISWQNLRLITCAETLEPALSNTGNSCFRCLILQHGLRRNCRGLLRQCLMRPPTKGNPFCPLPLTMRPAWPTSCRFLISALKMWLPPRESAASGGAASRIASMISWHWMQHPRNFSRQARNAVVSTGGPCIWKKHGSRLFEVQGNQRLAAGIGFLTSQSLHGASPGSVLVSFFLSFLSLSFFLWISMFFSLQQSHFKHRHYESHIMSMNHEWFT